MADFAGAAPLELSCVTSRNQASGILHPLRLRILGEAIEPVSATQLGARMGLPRQRVNYHVRELARSGFLKRAGRLRKRNMYEQRYVASARSYLLSPEILGPVCPDWRRVTDTASAAYLLALSAQMQADLIRFSREATRQEKRLPTLSLKSQFRFENERQRTAFTEALRQAVIEVIARHTSPDSKSDGSVGPGRAYRLVLGCYPYAPEPEAAAGEGEG